MSTLVSPVKDWHVVLTILTNTAAAAVALGLGAYYKPESCQL